MESRGSTLSWPEKCVERRGSQFQEIRATCTRNIGSGLGRGGA